MSQKQQMHRSKNGKWVKCEAKKRACRYDNVEGAHKYVLTDQKPQTKPVVEQETTETPANTKLADTVEQPEVRDSYLISPMYRQLFQNQIDKANRRLERAGVEERFTVEYETEVVVADDGNSYELVRATLNRPMIKQGDWSFLGTVDYFKNDEGEQVINLHGVGGRNLTEEYETEDAVRCDHCGHRRARSKTYVVKNSEGEYKQVGSNCLAAFLGVRPQGLWALEHDFVPPANQLPGGNWGRLDYTHMMIPTKQLIAIGLAISEGGKEYRGSSYADGVSTKSIAIKHLLGQKALKNDPQDYMEQAERVIKDTIFDTSEDYGRNMYTLLKEEQVPMRKVGYVVSAIPSYIRQTSFRKQEPEKAKGFLGDKGEKVMNVEDATVEYVQEIEQTYGYQRKIITLVVFRTPDNKLVKWLSSSNNPEMGALNKGVTVRLDSMIVKDHGEYRGEDQTVVKNVKFTLPPELRRVTYDD